MDKGFGFRFLENIRLFRAQDWGAVSIDLSNPVDVEAFEFASRSTVMTMRVWTKNENFVLLKERGTSHAIVRSSHMTPDVLMKRPVCCDWENMWTERTEKYEVNAEFILAITPNDIMSARKKLQTDDPLYMFLTKLIELVAKESPVLRDVLDDIDEAAPAPNN